LEFLTADGVRTTINIDQYEKLENLVFFDRVNSIFVLRASTVFAKIAAPQVNGKTEIFRRQLVAAQNIQSAGLYRQACNTLLPV